MSNLNLAHLRMRDEALRRPPHPHGGPHHADIHARPDLSGAELQELREIKERGARGWCGQEDLERWCALEPFRVQAGPRELGSLGTTRYHITFQPSKMSLAMYGRGCHCPGIWDRDSASEAQRIADWLSCLYRTNLRMQEGRT